MLGRTSLVMNAVSVVAEHADTIANTVELTASVVIPFAQFVPLIKDVADIFSKVTELYKTAQHNKNITNILMERISAAYSSVNMLQAREDLLTSHYYTSLQRLVQVLQNMKKYIEKITQYNTVQKFLEAKTIESKFKELCNEYDSSISLLNFNMSVGLRFNAEEEDKILREDIEELAKFQEALAESMNDVKDQVTNTNHQMNLVVERVSEMAITMQSLINDKKGSNQDKIDNIFHETALPFEDYEEADDKPRSERLRKYIHVKLKEEFAFKTVDKENLYLVKNPVTILKKLKDCLNIIHFYGLTYDGNKYYLVTEWAENGNLREYISSHGPNIRTKLKLRFAYDIAKGLNFLNAVKIVHRDIRSENIVITDHEVAKITNFKLSRGFNAVTGNVAVDKESVRYSAPEMLRRGITGEGVGRNESMANITKYDTKCEVYSFGIVLWEIAECKIPYEKFEDFMEITKKVVQGYREDFTVTDIPEKYRLLVSKSVDQNPGHRPTFAKMLTDLQDIFKKYSEEEPPPISRTSSYDRNSPIRPPSRGMSFSTIAAAEQDCALIPNWDSFNYLTVDKAVEEHKKDSMDKSKLYKCFVAYANLGNPRAKYWKAYYITKGWSDLKCSQDEKNRIAAKLFKEAADYGDEMPDAQLRYATMVMQGKGVEQNVDEAIEYFTKAAKNDHVVAMYNVATYYFSHGKEELGKYYMINAASKKYEQAINYCKKNNISY